ncbi:MAG: DNA mismatch repair protein MutS [Deltaproteobacteria bacterium]|nr:DNA mismatch repair protein MutS [Deltaproteobacteria bacterium]
MSQVTPMLRQFMEIKSAYPDSILFFRMGDFYEMFFEDAQTASKILGITLTSRGSHNGRKVPMCGVPHHSSRSYIAKLIETGRKVAICEQVEDPKKCKGIVKREVTRVITPGSVIDDTDIDGNTNLYLAAIFGNNGTFGLAYVDLSTGEFRLTEVEKWKEVTGELGRIAPAELLVLEDDMSVRRMELWQYRMEILRREEFDTERAESLLKEQLEVRSLDGFGCHGMNQGIVAAGAIVYYLKETQRGNPIHIRQIITYHIGDFMFLDEPTIWNLELFRTMRRQSMKGTLFHILDKTKTPMGSRLLKRWIGYPLVDLREIHLRLSAVASFKDDPMLRDDVRDQLEGIYDLERLNGRVSLGRANARDLIALKASIRRLPAIKKKLESIANEYLAEVSEKIDTLQDISDLIEKSVRDEPPISLTEGGIIKEGFDRDLDELISITRDGKTWIAELALSEQKRTGISNLKIGYNKVFGYYIEISKSNIHLAPPDYIRKQTLVNGERYINQALKEHEDKVITAEERRITLEHEIFERIREQVAHENQRIRDTARLIGLVDVIAGLAEVAQTNGYNHPTVNDEGVIHIEDGRHPVVEQTVKNEDFVPNDIHLDNSSQQFLIITGPNMAGKSTILRQVALTVLMSQIGSFIPAKKGTIGLVDRIFTRIGASDDLARGQSTFMVEMDETSNILRHATVKSLVILDEIGRGTSTYDGLSIAWAVAEALHDRDGKGIRTLFATHYHELTELLTTRKRVKNFNIAVREWNDRIVFLRKLVPGGTNRSYGIQVARIAGIPEEVVQRAKEILENLEGKDVDEAGRPRLAMSRSGPERDDNTQLNLFAGPESKIRKWIGGLDINGMTPLEAIAELEKLQKYIMRKENETKIF